MSARPNPGLVALALRRTASGPVIAWTALVALAFALAPGAPPATWLEAGASDPHIAGGLVRESVWTGFVIAIAPLILFRSVRDAAFWRRPDSAWLASRAVSNATVLVSTWIGATAAGLVLACACGTLAEMCAGGDAHVARLVGSIAGPGHPWIDGTRPLVWRCEENAVCREALTAGGASARIELGLASGAGSACAVVMRARRADGTPSEPRPADAQSWTEETRANIGSHGTIDVALPRDDVTANTAARAIEFELELGSPEAKLCVLGDELHIYARDSVAHGASISILARVALMLLAWTAFALGCSAWVSAPTAALAVLAALAPAWWSGGTGASALAWLPGADLFDALEIVAGGRAPAGIGWVDVGGAILIALVGLAIGWAGLARWRRTR